MIRRHESHSGERTRGRRHAYAAAAALALCIAPLAACGSSSPEAEVQRSASPTVITSAPTESDAASDGGQSESVSQKGTTVCASDNLSATLAEGSGGGAGSDYPYLVLTNNGDASCTVTGYPGVSLTSGGEQIGAAAERDDSVTPTTITLEPGESAYSELQIANAANYDTDACKPQAADAILVYPPDQTKAISVSTSAYTGCSSEDIQLLTVRALPKGSGE